jgi:hypothetical protein
MKFTLDPSGRLLAMGDKTGTIFLWEFRETLPAPVSTSPTATDSKASNGINGHPKQSDDSDSDNAIENDDNTDDHDSTDDEQGSNDSSDTRGNDDNTSTSDFDSNDNSKNKRSSSDTDSAEHNNRERKLHCKFKSKSHTSDIRRGTMTKRARRMMSASSTADFLCSRKARFRLSHNQSPVTIRQIAFNHDSR